MYHVNLKWEINHRSYQQLTIRKTLIYLENFFSKITSILQVLPLALK